MVKTAGSSPNPSHGGERFEAGIENEDAAYSRAHAIGALLTPNGSEAPFQWPSVMRTRLHKEQVAKDRPPVVASATLNNSNFTDPEAQRRWQELGDPETALEDVHGKKVVIKEGISVNAEFDEDSEQTVSWLGCDSREEAEAYVERVGSEYQDPGPGEGLGVFEYREIHDNPHFNPAAAKEAK